MNRSTMLLIVLALALAGAPGVSLAADGAALYKTNCESCHGPEGKGDGPVGKALNPPPRDFSKGVFKFDTDGDGKTGTDADLMNVIKNGAAAYGGNALMAPWGHLPEEDIKALVAFIRTLKK